MADCNQHICSQGKDEAQLNQVFSKSGQRVAHAAPNRLPIGTGPLNAVELGRAAWPILHRLSLSYPESPTEE